MTDEHEIFAALEKGEQRKVISLLEHDPSLANIVNEYGQTPFWLASAFGYIDLVKIMLQMGEVNYKVRDHRGRHALHAAQEFHNKDIIEILNPVFGVGVYSEPIEKQDSYFESVVFTAKTFFQELFYRVIIFTNKFKLATGFVFASALLVSAYIYYESPNFQEVRMIATGGNDIDIESTILEALSNKPISTIDFKALDKQIKSEGWHDMRIQSIQELMKKEDEFLVVQTCSVVLTNDTETQKRKITVTETKNGEYSVWSDIQALSTEYKSTRISLVKYMINYCFIRI